MSILKINTLLLFLSISVGSIAQSNTETIKGHWQFCDKTMGYTECLISDSTLHWLSIPGFNMSGSHLRYRTENKKIITWYGSDDYTESMKFKVIDQNHIKINNNKETYNLVRMTEKVLNFADFDCSFKMNRSQFNDKLKKELESRQLNSKLCPQIIEVVVEDHSLTHSDDDFLEEEFLSPPPGYIIPKSSVYNISFREEILNTEVKNNFETQIFNIQYNTDSTEAILIVDALQYCYATYNSRVYLNSNDELEVQFRTIDSMCKEKCKMRFTFDLRLKNHIIDKVIFPE